jgi:hypothetical protein
MSAPWRRDITIKLHSPLDANIVEKIIKSFDGSNIYMNGKEESGWWGNRTPHGIPSNHKIENKKGLHIRGVDFTEGAIPAYLGISKDRKIIKADGRSAYDVVEILLESKISYEPKVDVITESLNPKAVEEYKRSRKVTQAEMGKLLEK